MHGWVVYYADGHQVEFDAAECEACSGALRATDDNGDVVVLVRGWQVAVRAGTPVTVTPAPALSPAPPTATRPFA
jgi:hypothetical protein